MTQIAADRVRDVTTTTGTGAVTVSGTAPTGYRTFSAVCAVSDVFIGLIAHQTLNEWEVGYYTYSASNQITRTTIRSSSNAGAAVNFSAGTKDVVLVQCADRMATTQIAAAGATDQLTFTTGAQVERLRITSAGKIVIGGAAAQTALFSDIPNLQIHSSAANNQFSMQDWANDVNAPSIYFTKSRNTTIGSHTVVQSGDELGSIWWGGSDGAAFRAAAAIECVVDAAVTGGGAADMPTRLVFSTTPDGSATPTERLRIDKDGLLTLGAGQIKFPATVNPSSDVNTLDDYEEGTWTPDVKNSASSSTWGTKSGTYIKIGSLVIAWFNCDGGNSGTAGSSLTLSGLPFTVGTVPSGNSIMGGCNCAGAGASPIWILNTGVFVSNGGGGQTFQATYATGFVQYRT